MGSGGGGAQQGLSQVNQGAGAIGAALGQISSAIGGDGGAGGGMPMPSMPSGGSNPPSMGIIDAMKNMGGLTSILSGNKNMMKKGGSVKKYASGGKINLDACGVSTHTKSKSSPNW